MVVDANRRALESLGLTRQELIGQSPMLFDADFTPTFGERLIGHLSGGQSLTFETRHRRKDGSVKEVPVLLRIDTPIEVDYYLHGGILPFVLRELVAA